MKHFKFSSPRKLMKKYPFLRETDTIFSETRAKVYCEICPKEFLRLASPLGEYELNRTRTKEISQRVVKTLENKDDWTYNDAHDFFYGMYLTLDIDYLKISGHEGRHRALGFIEAGYEYMPMVFNLMGRNPISDKTRSISYYDYAENITKEFKETVITAIQEKKIFSENDRSKEAISLYTKLGVCKRCRAKPCRPTCQTTQIRKIQTGQSSNDKNVIGGKK